MKSIKRIKNKLKTAQRNCKLKKLNNKKENS
jgi:hypothetical protein